MTNITRPDLQVQPQDFILSVEHSTRREDAFVLLELFNRATGLPAVMWGAAIIGYGEYTYTLANGKQEKMLRCGFSPRKQNLSLYVMAAKSEYPTLFNALGKHKTSKACLYINKLSDVDLTVLESIIEADMDVMNRRYPV